MSEKGHSVSFGHAREASGRRMIPENPFQCCRHRYDLDSDFQSREKIELMANLSPDQICERYRNAY
jgi:hypothetical protein